MKKILFITNFANKSGCDNKITSFSWAAYEAANKLGMEFHINTNKENLKPEDDNDVVYHNVGIYRNPFSKDVLKAYRQLCAVCEENKFDIIHCNTPIGGVLGRIAGKKYGIPCIIYQAHGFHFYKGAPGKNWLLYYPVEKWLAHYTDALITINHEDYGLAKTKFRPRKGGNVYYVPGVGIDCTQYKTERPLREEKRKELNIPPDAFVLISAGELHANKNNQVIISAMEQLKRDDIHYVLCGIGSLETPLRKQADAADLHDNVHFLGYRNDVKELYKMADCFVMPSLREGLPRSLMEAMASGLPCIVSKIRGNVDLLENTGGGFLCGIHDVSAYAEKINVLSSDMGMREEMGNKNLIAIEKFSMATVVEAIRKIYEAECAKSCGI